MGIEREGEWERETERESGSGGVKAVCVHMNCDEGKQNKIIDTLVLT